MTEEKGEEAFLITITRTRTRKERKKQGKKVV